MSSRICLTEVSFRLKILVVHEVNYLEKVIYEIHEFPELLALRGHDVTFFEFAEGLHSGNAFKTRSKRISGRVYSDASLHLSTPMQLGIPALDRLWALLSCIPALYQLFRTKDFDVVLNYAVPTYGLQVLALARLFKVPVVHRALDVSHLIRESAFNPLIRVWEKVMYRTVDLLSANNDAMESYCRNLSGRSGPSQVNYPPLDASHFKAIKRDDDLAKSLGISPTDQVIMYMGSFFYFSGLTEAIRSFAMHASQQPNLKMLLIGGGEQDKELRDLVSELALDDKVIFTGFISFDELPRYMKLATVAINTLHPTLVAHVAFPHKVLQYMATGIPTVSTKLDGLYSAFGDNSGLTWIDEKEDAISASLELLEKPDMLETIKKKQLATVEELFALDTTVDSLEHLLQSASSQGK